MTCTHVLGLIDAGPFAQYPRSHLAAAWEHARQCPTCGPALETAARLTTDLSALAQPASPPDLERRILARIAQIDQEYTAPADTSAAAGSGLSVDDWSVRAAAGGLTAALAIAGSMPAAAGMRILTSPTTQALALTAGLILYAAGLFAPLGGKVGFGGKRSVRSP